MSCLFLLQNENYPSSTKVFQEFGHSFVSYVLIFKINSILFRIQKLLTHSAFLCAKDFLKSQIVAVSKQLLARKLAKILFVFIKIFEYVRSYSSVSLLQSVAVKCSGVAWCSSLELVKIQYLITSQIRKKTYRYWLERQSWKKNPMNSKLTKNPKSNCV